MLCFYWNLSFELIQIKSNNMKKLITLLGIILVTILQIILGGCSASHEVNEVEKLKPIKVHENFGIFRFSKVISEVTISKVIGGDYKGLLNISNFNHYAPDFSSIEYNDIFERIVNYELSDAGYKIDTSPLKDSNQVSRFLVGAVVMDAVKNSFYKGFSRWTEYMLDIKWEIYDKQEKKVIFSKIERGNSETNFKLCIKISFNNLLSNIELVDAIRSQYKIFHQK